MPAPSLSSLWGYFMRMMLISSLLFQTNRHFNLKMMLPSISFSIPPWSIVCKNIIVTCQHDLHLVEDVLKAKMGVFNAESVMSSVLTGSVCFDVVAKLP